MTPHTHNQLPKRIVLVSKHFGPLSGGEAIKAFQFAEFLQENGIDVTVVTHERAISAQGGDRFDGAFLLVEDGPVQQWISWLKPIRGLLDLHFHLSVRRLIHKNITPDPDSVVHYVGPISPIMPKFLVRGHPIVIGPLSGNIFYPPAFRARAPKKYQLAEKLHPFVQRLMGIFYPEKRRASRVLVSGYERTRISLRLAGVREDKMVNVVDSGINNNLVAQPRVEHVGENFRFVAIGRMIDYKGHDLAIRAVAAAKNPRISLDIYGHGERLDALKALRDELGLEDRVQFLGWLENDELTQVMQAYRGFVFPTLCEANGIVMQEAMMIGTPVIATRWGGPIDLADAHSALFVEPRSEEHMVTEIAAHMGRLAQDADLANALSEAARKIARDRFTWDSVAASWMEAGYGATLPSLSDAPSSPGTPPAGEPQLTTQS